MKKQILASLLLCILAVPASAATPALTVVKSDTQTPVTSASKPALTPIAAVTPNIRRKIFNAETYTLKNGMLVVLVSNHRAPVALQMVWYKVGRTDEATGKSGLAHFLEHLMFKGSDNVPPGELSKRIRAMGGNDNAFTTHDFTAYFQTIAVARLEEAMALEADRMRSILLPPDQFESERQVVLEERRQRTENDPRSYFMDQLRYALYPGHPYSVPVIGWESEIKTLSRDDAKAWHDKWYTPNNAILVVTGDLTLDQLKPMVERTYGAIPARPLTREALPAVNEFPGNTVLTLRDPRIREPQFVRLYRVPSFTQNKQDALALDVLQEIMSGNSSTRLYQALVVQQKIATSASFGYEDSSRGTAMFSASVSPAEGKTDEEAETAYDAEIKKLAEGGVTATELSEAKARIRDSVAFMHDSLSAPAHAIGQSLINGISLDDIEYWPDLIDTVTAEQVKAVAQKYLLPSGQSDQKPNYVTGYIYAVKPQPGATPPPAPTPVQEIR